MHLIQVVDGDTLERQATERAPFGPGFTPEQVKDAVAMECWGSSFKDPGPDHTEFRLLGEGDKLIAKKTVGGY